MPVVEAYAERRAAACTSLVNTYGRGPANAIRYGIDHASHAVVVVTMADGSDDPRQIDPLARLVERGVVVAAASRYSAGGQQVGGPLLKGAALADAPDARSAIARPGRHPRRDQQLQGLLHRRSSARSASTAAAASRSASS